MSYDVDISNESFNYTSNLGPLFYAHFEGVQGISALSGLRGTSAVRAIDTFLSNMNAERDLIGQKGMQAKYDAANKWGDFVSAVSWVLEIRDACERFPRHKVKVYK